MRIAIIAIAFLLSALASGCSEGGPQSLTAFADLYDAKGQKIGTAQLKEAKNGVEIRLSASHLPPGKHGYHIHETGKCEAPDFKSAGGHFNPEQKKHGEHNPEGHHAGDLTNLTVSEDGQVNDTQIAEHVTLEKNKAVSLLKAGGTALVIHEKEDDLKTDPAGNSGKRIACGVIEAKQ
ncbi:superoxide dismutase family protein [Lihuaxuella thermophila]|uniref:Superoxide dismutase [Cu-Zn] n=1 Tax=Lihuaxuella thermophila TaxID=1173111 RepID=A0A1H8AR34_9BACL|nr:superoxide dismutase, Cu-Zn family [Lihuaxuella thermophila]